MFYLWNLFHIYVSQKHFIRRNTQGRQFFSVSTSKVHSEMNENCIYNVWGKKAYHLSSRATCSYVAYFFSKFGAWVGEITHWKQTGWILVIYPDGCENTFQNRSAYKWYQLNKQGAYTFRRQYFRSNPRFETELLALFYMVSKKHLTIMIANMSTVLHRDAKGLCPRLTQSVGLWSLMTK